MSKESNERLFMKYFPTPFSYDKWGEWCTSINGQLCFQFRPDSDLEPDKIKRYVDIINGKYKNVFDNEYSYDDQTGFIIEDGVPFISIRGWGHLTSSGGLNLSTKDAAAVQDSLAHYIISKLTSK